MRERDRLKDVGVDGRIILKWTLCFFVHMYSEVPAMNDVERL
jgi:hypothetical protein